MVRNVTPNPATGSQSCSLRVLPSCCELIRGPRGSAGSASDVVGWSYCLVLLDGRDRPAGVEREGDGGAADGAPLRHRRHREPTVVALRGGLTHLVVLLRLVSEEEDAEEEHDGDPETDQEVLAVDAAVERDDADRGDRDDPEQRERDEP